MTRSSDLYLRLARGFLYVLLGLLPLFYLPVSLEPLEVNKQTLLVLLTSASALAWIGSMVSARAVSVRRGWVNLLPVPLVAFTLLSAAFSSGPYLSWVGTAGQEYMSALSVLAYALLWFLCANLLALPAHRRTAFAVLLGSGAFAGILGILGILGVRALPIPGGMLGNTVGSPNAFGMYLASVAALACALFLVHRESDAVMYRGRKGAFQHAAIFLACAVAFLALMLVDYAPVWAALEAGVLALFALSMARAKDIGPGNRFTLPFLLLVSSVPFLLVFDRPLPAKIPTEVTPDASSSWAVARETLSHDGALLGSGPGTFVYQYGRYRPEEVNKTAFWNTRFDRASSFAFTVLPTFGVLGTLGWAVALLGSLACGIGAFLRARERERLVAPFVLVPPLAALLIALCLYGGTLTLLTLCFALSGLVCGAAMREGRADLDRAPRLSLALSALLVLAATAIATGLFGSLIRYASEAAFAHAVRLDRADAPMKEIVASLDRAASLNRWNDVFYRNLAQAFLLMTGEEIKALSGAATPMTDEQRAYVQALTGAAVNAGVRATELGPDNALNWLARGALYREFIPLIGNAGEHAVEAYQRAIALEPLDPENRTELGKAFLTLAENNRALTAAEDKAVADEALAKVAGYLKQAEEQFDKAIALKADYAPAHYQLGLIYERQGKIGEAVGKMESVSQYNPLDVGVFFQLGMLYLRRGSEGDQDRAEKAFLSAIALSPSYSNARWFLASIYEQKRDLPKAIEQVGKVLEYNPDNQLVKAKLDRLKAGKVSSTTPVPLTDPAPATP
ncbi:hypothetical protein EPO34_03870 [Patescibacteria group bacterium]|nr:MAG: hypothetical protein EPO34_03870 [Patescibacteria group bacterium]